MTMLLAATAVLGWTMAGVWLGLWLRQRRHVRIAWQVASQAVADRKRLEGATPAVMVISGEPTVESVEAVAWMN